MNLFRDKWLQNTILALKCLTRGFSRLKGQVNVILLTLDRFKTNAKLSVSLYQIVRHEMWKNVKIMYKTCKIQFFVTIFWRRIGTSPLVETC